MRHIHVLPELPSSKLPYLNLISTCRTWANFHLYVHTGPLTNSRLHV